MILGMVSSVFYVYVDWTLESPPRPFYVGKGVISRVRSVGVRRTYNRYHQNIVRTYGQCREIVLATSIEGLAFEHEKALITELRTRTDVPGHWGANMTEGGEGVSNPSQETRAKKAENARRFMTGRKQTKRKGWHIRAPRSETYRKRISNVASNRSPEWKQKISEGVTEWHARKDNT